jgi:hypothetical protein
LKKSHGPETAPKKIAGSRMVIPCYSPIYAIVCTQNLLLHIYIMCNNRLDPSFFFEIIWVRDPANQAILAIFDMI